jgi:hypothetical protein
MIKIKHSIARWFLIIAVISLTFGVTSPRTAQAIWITEDLMNFAVNTITSIKAVYSAVSAEYMKLKETVLDPLAWLLGKQILQTITADIVDWINNDFEGNPAFISNPTGFFLDTADQLTGAFIANSGPLSSLCSPFSLDIRANLGLQTGQSRSQRSRYACTLSTIINSAQNSSINVGGNVTLNGNTVTGGGVSVGGSGKSIEGFMNGDFSQGGWPAFIAMTTEPQNNYMGAQLMAQSDIQIQIASKQASIKADVLAGGGFMSYKKCEDLGTVSSDAEADQADAIAGNDPNVTTKVNPDGSITYQLCHTETPGSTISASLNKALGAGNDSLVAADEIDEILSAAFNYVLRDVLKTGLNSSSQTSSNGTASIMNTLRTSTGSSTQNIASNISASVEQAIPVSEQYQSVREQTVAAILELETYANSIYSKCEAGGFSSQGDTVQSILTSLLPLKNQYQGYATDAADRVQQLYDIRGEIEAASGDPQTLNQLSMQYASQLSPTKMITEIDINNANTDLTNLTQEGGTIPTTRSSLDTYDMMCNMPSGGGSGGTTP